jgi:flagellar biogenesis protein FliO
VIPESRGEWFTWVLALIVVCALVLGGIYGWRKYAAHKRNAHPAPAPTGEMRTVIRRTNSA